MTDQAEDALRHYLQFLADPQGLVDDERIKELETEIESTSDPIAQLRAHSEVAKLKNVDEEALRAGFIQHARAWADANDVTVEAFRRMGVPEADLKAAKLTGNERRARRTPPASVNGHGRPAAGEVQKRKPRVSTESIVEVIPAQGEFTVRSVAERSGASDGTVRKVIDDLVAQGEVLEAGTAKTAGTRGRAPLAFRRR